MHVVYIYTRWFKYDRDDLCVNKSQFVPVIFEPPCIYMQAVSVPSECDFSPGCQVSVSDDLYHFIHKLWLDNAPIGELS
jgi:hypothetical protein